MPPELFDVLACCPTTKVFKTRDRSTEPAWPGCGIAPCCRSASWPRCAGPSWPPWPWPTWPNGLVLSLPRSKTNQTGEQAELVVLPRAGTPARCPVTALQTWLAAAGITDGPVFRPVSTGNRAIPRPLHPESINALVQAAVARAGLDPAPYSAHSLRAGFVAYAHLRGASDRAIAYQTRHRSLASLGGYVCISTAWADNADQLATRHTVSDGRDLGRPRPRPAGGRRRPAAGAAGGAGWPGRR